MSFVFTKQKKPAIKPVFYLFVHDAAYDMARICAFKRDLCRAALFW